MKRIFWVLTVVFLLILGYMSRSYSFVGIEEEVGDTWLIKVHIAGAVNNPAVYELDSESRLEDLIIFAGGMTEEADEANVNLAMRLRDGEKIVIGYKGEEKPSGKRIELDSSVITEVDGIGTDLAERISEYLKDNEVYSFDELIEVNGVGEKKLEAIKKHFENDL